jgi:alpha-ketoglutarate-dependent taurine dioxygenase
VKGQEHTNVLAIDSEHGKANSWHTDVTFVDRVPAISILRAIELPPYGGSTVWADTARAYADLPEALKALVDRLWAVHTNVHDYAGHADSTRIGGVDVKEQAYREEFVSQRYETEHPVIFELLQNRVTRLENTVRWQWADGDVAIWDNRATQHYGVADYDDLRRRLHRITLAGDVPVSVEGVAGTTVVGDAAHFSAL